MAPTFDKKNLKHQWIRKKNLPLRKSDEPLLLDQDSLCLGCNFVKRRSEILEKKAVVLTPEEEPTCMMPYTALSMTTLQTLHQHLVPSKKPKEKKSSVKKGSSVWPRAMERFKSTGFKKIAESIKEERHRKLSEQVVLKKQGGRASESKIKFTDVLAEEKKTEIAPPSSTEMPPAQELLLPKSTPHQSLFSVHKGGTSNNRRIGVMAPVSKGFERIDLSHLPVSRAKTGYIIKETDIKDPSLTNFKKTIIPSKKSSDVLTGPGESDDVLGTLSGRTKVMTMPALMDNVTSLTIGVTIVQNGVRRSSVMSPLNVKPEGYPPVIVKPGYAETTWLNVIIGFLIYFTSF